jgi:hypothetical protein
MADKVDLQDQLKLLVSELPKTEKRQKLEYQKIERLVKKSELLLSKKEEQLKVQENKIHAWILQKSKKSMNTLVKIKPGLNFYEFGKWLKTSGNRTEFHASKFVNASLEEMDKWIDLPAQPVLHNLFIRYRQIEAEINNSKLEFKELRQNEGRLKKELEKEMDVLQLKIDAIKRDISRSSSINASRYKTYGTASVAKSKVPKMDIENWEDAENFAVKYMRWLGFTDARKTRAGSDEGKDVESSKAVAQVKDMGTGVSRPMLQQLFGVAAAEKKIPVFFARSYAKTAKEWGQKHGMALFQFSIRGDVKAVSTKAEQILKKKSS